ncbi:hypothetical protein [Acinetobacter populi]|nr:hypothetical protein [Acinetobacter populi]
MAHVPDDERPDFRVLIIPFGSSGYKAWYHYKIGGNIIIVSIKHQREAGF